MTAYVATVTARTGAKYHLDVAGRAACGTRGTIRNEGNAELSELTSIDRLCKRCIPAIKTALKGEIAHYGGGSRAHRHQPTIASLRNLQRMLQTSAEYRASIEFADQLRAQHVAPPAPVARKNAFADLRDAYAAANQPRQLALAA